MGTKIIELKNVDITITEEKGNRTFVINENIEEEEKYIMNLQVSKNKEVLWIKINDIYIACLDKDKIFKLFKGYKVNELLHEWRTSGMEITGQDIITEFNGSYFNISKERIFSQCNCYKGGIFDFTYIRTPKYSGSNLVEKWKGTDTPIVY